ncbi:MAG: hypothetical protein K5656_02440, partial [Lachnospiraceae bacterium]|nr:hypothetical protein [Lachnospiraceae bacterium]
DRIFTNYALDHSLVVSNLSISMPEETVLFGPYPYSESYKLQEQRVAAAAALAALEAEEDVDDKKEKKKSAVEEARFNVDSLTNSAVDTQGSGVYSVTVGLQVYGKEKDCQLLIDELMRDQSLHIDSYSWGETVSSTIGLNDDGTLYEKKGYKSLTVSVSLMMYDEDAYQPPKETETSEETDSAEE